jgi:hypothetical protein
MNHRMLAGYLSLFLQLATLAALIVGFRYKKLLLDDFESSIKDLRTDLKDVRTRASTEHK